MNTSFNYNFNQCLCCRIPALIFPANNVDTLKPTSTYAGALSAGRAGGSQSLGGLLRFSVTNQCSDGHPGPHTSPANCDFFIDTFQLLPLSQTVRVIVQTNSSWPFSGITLSFTSEAWHTSYWQIAISKVISNSSHTDYSIQKFVFTVWTINFQ